MYLSLIRPMLDYSTALILFIISLPIMTIVFLIVFVNNKGAVLFFQKRTGKNLKIFTILKFRTMASEETFNTRDQENPVLGKVGRLLRKTHIDEFPQLINVIKGDLSLIGPRPLLPEYISCYDNTANYRHKVKPGITGLVQILGGNSINWTRRFLIDKFYVEKRSIALDSYIICKTAVYIIKSIFSKGLENSDISESYTEYLKNKL